MLYLEAWGDANRSVGVTPGGTAGGVDITESV